MGSPLTPAELRKLVGILGRLGSDFDGERAAAGLLASKMLRAAGLGWDDVLVAGPASRQGSGEARNGTTGAGGADSSGWRSMLAFCLRHRAVLTDWELHFLSDLQGRRGAPSSRQVAKVSQIDAALRARGLS